MSVTSNERRLKAVPSPAPMSGGPGANESRERTVVRLHTDTKARAAYWAQRREFNSVNEYIAEAVEEKIRRENLDYDLPTLEIARQTQLIDEVKSLSTNVANLERVMTTSFESLLSLTRGDSYLMDPEDGELPE